MSETHTNIQKKTVALVDWYWQGHHPTYLKHFITALEELNINILVLCSNPNGAEANANETRLRVKSDTSSRGHAIFQKIHYAKNFQMRLRSGRIRAIYATIRHFKGIENQVLEWSQTTGCKVSGIIYACIYTWDFEWFYLVQPFLRLPWTGLYLHAMFYRVPGRINSGVRRLPHFERMFRSRLCKGIAILDEGIVGEVAKNSGKPVVLLPDMTDERMMPDEKEPLLVSRLRQFAKGRPIVGLFGHLKKSKGVLAFLEAAEMPAVSDVCFALGGEMTWSDFTNETTRVQDSLEECTNVWNHLATINDGPTLNGLMASCDVIIAAYVDFPHSSGIQTKAAVLKKPLIVSEGYLMAERTRRFHLGEVIPQEDAQALCEAIVKITKDPAKWVADNNPRWSDYHCEHSFERLKSSLKQLLESF